MSNYKNRFVAFVDILGFSDLVRKSANDDDIRIQLLNVTHGIAEKVKHHRPDLWNEDIFGDVSSLSVINFSDSVIISDAANAVGFWKIVLFINTLFSELAQYGTLCRGAITVGQFYQKGSVAFGPAFLEAYHLESQIAVNPRIMISVKALDMAQNFAASETWASEYLRKWIVRDIDGAAFIDQFADCTEVFSRQDVELINLYTAQMMLIADNIKRQLYAHIDNPRIFEKYEWIAEQYNNMVSVCKVHAEELDHIDVFDGLDGHIKLRTPFEF